MKAQSLFSKWMFSTPVCLSVLIILGMYSSCNVTKPDDKSGSLRIQASVIANVHISQVICTVMQGVERVHEGSYDKTDSQFIIILEDLDPAENYTVSLLGLNSSGDISVKGSRDNICVSGGDETSVNISLFNFYPVLSSPADGSRTDNREPTFKWGSVIGGTAYSLMVSTSSDFEEWQINETTFMDISYTPTLPLAYGRYYWRVRARDEEERWSAWSSVWCVTISNHTVSPPNVPAGQSGVEIGVPISFSTGGSFCSKGHSIQYRYDWGDGTVSDWGSVSQSKIYSSAGMYPVKAQARCETDTDVESDWSDEVKVLIVEYGTMTGNDGKTYKTIKIGSQWWMMENLKERRYRNGVGIAEVKEQDDWQSMQSLHTGALCAYDNNADNANIYGYLYNWFAVNDSRNIAPEGWHVPEKSEWQILFDFLGTNFVAGGKMKEQGTSHWISPNAGATNESGFTALPGGIRSVYSFVGLGRTAFFWSATRRYEGSYPCSHCCLLSYRDPVVDWVAYQRTEGLSVRLVRD